MTKGTTKPSWPDFSSPVVSTTHLLCYLLLLVIMALCIMVGTSIRAERQWGVYHHTRMIHNGILVDEDAGVPPGSLAVTVQSDVTDHGVWLHTSLKAVRTDVLVTIIADPDPLLHPNFQPLSQELIEQILNEAIEGLNESYGSELQNARPHLEETDPGPAALATRPAPPGCAVVASASLSAGSLGHWHHLEWSLMGLGVAFMAFVLSLGLWHTCRYLRLSRAASRLKAQRCARCGYNVASTASPICSECGLDVAAARRSLEQAPYWNPRSRRVGS